MHIGQPDVATAESEGERLVVEAHEMQDGGPEVVDGALVLHGLVTEVVGGAVGEAGLHAAAGHPDGEAERIVIATVRALREGRAAEFTGPDDQGGIEQAALAQILDECGDGLIGLLRHLAVAFLHLAVVIPGIRRRCRRRGCRRGC